MQVEVTIRTPQDYDFGDTTARQIRFLKDGPTTEIVSKATGYINFIAATKGRGPGEMRADTIFAEAAVPEPFFATLARWLQTPGVSLEQIEVGAFGEALVQVDTSGGITFHWQTSEKAGGPRVLGRTAVRLQRKD